MSHRLGDPAVPVDGCACPICENWRDEDHDAVLGAPPPLCRDCLEDDEETPATEEWDETGPNSGGLHLCDHHVSRRQDAVEPDYQSGGLAEVVHRQHQALQQRRA